MNKQIKKIILLGLMIIATSCTSQNRIINENKKEIKILEYSGQIILYGEKHGDERIIKKEFDIWNDYYNKGMRHLFLELPYYTAEFLNIWMHERDDKILNEIYSDWEGTAGQNIYSLEFYKKIKIMCPETVFHGTDVGHQYNTTGQRYISYLVKNKMIGSDKYIIAKNVIDQGINYYGQKKNDVYRENNMVENFIRELKSLGNNDVMGIYGAAHTELSENDYANSIPCMANQLNSLYKYKIQSTDLSKITEEIREDEIVLNNKKYRALYFGKESLRGFKDYEYREFWRIEDSYNDFKNNKITNDVLPYDNYPMEIELGQLFMIDYKKTDGTLIHSFYISNGRTWQNKLATENIEIIY